MSHVVGYHELQISNDYLGRRGFSVYYAPGEKGGLLL